MESQVTQNLDIYRAKRVETFAALGCTWQLPMTDRDFKFSPSPIEKGLGFFVGFSK